MGFLKNLLGPVLGGGLGYLLAPFTGGLSIPASMALGAGLGGGAQSLFEGGNLGDALLSAGMGGLGGYGVGSMIGGLGSAGAATLGAGAPSIAAPVAATGAEGTAAAGLGTSGLSISSLTSPYAGGASLSGSLPGAADMLSTIGGVAAPTMPAAGVGAGGAGAGGMLSGIKKYAPYLIGADLLTKGMGISSEQGASQEALDQYLGAHQGATEWTASDRSNMMKAIMGLYSEEANALKRKSSSSLAGRGISGGAYGKQVDKIQRESREGAARSLASTFGPSGKPPSADAFFQNAKSQGRDPYSETMNDVLNIGGQFGTMAMLSKYLGR